MYRQAFFQRRIYENCYIRYRPNDSCNIWLNGLVADEKLLGARVELREDENSEENIVAGIMKFHVFITPHTPAQEIDFVLEYDAACAETALA